MGIGDAAMSDALTDFAATLRKLPRTVAIKVATAAAPVLTQLAQSTFNASEDAYGNAWTPGADGQRITLKKSGSLGNKIHYVAIGTRLRVALGVSYAKYVVGKRPVMPRGPLPVAYSQALARVTAEVCKREMGATA